MSSVVAATTDERGVNAGWLASLLVIVAVLGIGAIFWFHYHPW